MLATRKVAGNSAPNAGSQGEQSKALLILKLRDERSWMKKGELKLLLTPISRDAGTDLKVVPVALYFC